VSNPRDLRLALLAEALWIERTLAHDLLPEMHRQSDSELLATALAEHLEETRAHAQALEEIFLELGAEPTAAASRALAGLSEDDVTVVEPRLSDLRLIDRAARVEHLELAVYESLRALVDDDRLARIYDDERHALERLGELRARFTPTG
jgi:ferritin-like metal-binding protein YciE